MYSVLRAQVNTCDQNMARAVEIIELNARVQGQLFKLLSVCASDGESPAARPAAHSLQFS